LTQGGKAVKGIHVRITGAKINLRTKASNSKGIVKQTLKMKKAGVLVFTPIASKACNTKLVGVTNVFTPPVTGQPTLLRGRGYTPAPPFSSTGEAFDES